MSGRPSREEFVAFFNEADTDGSGDLSLEEVIAVLRKNGYKGSDGQIKEYFKMADMSMDNRISMEEYLIAVGLVPEQDHKTATMRRLFKDFDKDGNGEIDREELRSLFKSMNKMFTDEELERMIAMVDKDDSKTINYEEFIEHFFGIKPEEKK